MKQNLLPDLSISIVSHRQIQLAYSLLSDLQQYCADTSIEVILTVNVEESLSLNISDYGFPIKLIRNTAPKGFGENHNAAFLLATGKYFCVLNPDIRFTETPFPLLIKSVLEANVGLVAPRIVNIEGGQEDSARKFPSRIEIFKKIFGGKSAVYMDATDGVSTPDWVAGMFMLIPHHIFRKIGGFNEDYFLYYEDVDLCARLTLMGFRIAKCSKVSVMHDARRSSRKNLKFFRFHVSSMLRFFSSDVYRKIRQRSSVEQ